MAADPNEFTNSLKHVHDVYARHVNGVELELRQTQTVVREQTTHIALLEAKVKSLQESMLELSLKYKNAVDERNQLASENAQLSSTAQRYKRDLSKLIHFKQAILHTFDEEETAIAQSPIRDAPTTVTSKYAMPAGARADNPDALIAEIDRSIHLSSPHAARATAAPAAAAAARPTSPSRVSIHESGRGIAMHDLNAAAGSTAVGGSGGGGSGGGGGGGDGEWNDVDGREFFKRARARLSFEQFKTFLDSIKALNNHETTREAALKQAWQIFGPDGEDLYAQFKTLIVRHG